MSITDTPPSTVASGDQPTYKEAVRIAEQARMREGIKRYSQGMRLFYGLLWLFWTAALAIGSIGAIGKGSVGAGLIGLVLAGFAGRYDYRIWTYQRNSAAGRSRTATRLRLPANSSCLGRLF
jgi:hypothetical protein